MLVTLLILFVVFCLLWWAIGYIPFPAGFPPQAGNVLRVVLIVVAALYLLRYAHIF